jgi:hypothetical protein
VEVYQKFQNATLYESDGFRKTLSLSQGTLTATAESSSGLLHIEENNGTLRIFVPRDPQQRKLCYPGQLPKALVRYLGITDPAATGSFRIVILVPADVLDDVLDEDGIVQVPNIDSLGSELSTPEDLEPDELAPEVSTLTPTSSEDQPSTGLRLQSAATHSIEVRPEATEFRYERRPSSTSVEDDHLVHQPTLRSQSENTVPLTYDAQYVQLLEKVIEAARRAAFPTAEALDLQDLADALPSADTQGPLLGLRAQNQIERDIKIGAAGELYVSLCQPRFTFYSRLVA